ncbi:MAG: TIM barrel protein [Clostridia bacterium]|nr:TIM barrel protein [Clostridia bacterium]
MNEIKFGPSGSDLAFYELGYESTTQMPEYVESLGLDCFEYSFGKGVRISAATAEKIGEAFKERNIEISVHAPYFINLSNPDPEKINNSFGYLTASMDALLLMGGKRVVFHPGSMLKLTREEAYSLMMKNAEGFLPILNQDRYDGLYVCPETMGKVNQMGTVDEIADICRLSDKFLPCVDFGHVNAREQGVLKTRDDYQRIIDTLSNKLTDFQVKNMHVHFSKIEYGAKGEIKHLTFEDTVYGPEFEPLAEVLVKNSLTPYIVSESDGTQGKDAKYMKSVYNSIKNAK